MLKYSVILLILACSNPLFADHQSSSISKTHYARVTDVQIVYQRVAFDAPVEQCWQETVPRQHSSSAPIFGAIVGGALGNELGHNKSNKRVATIVGAVLGATVAADISRQRSNGRYESVARCEIQSHREWRDEVVGYDVSYRYHGEIYYTRLNYNPGREIEIEVNVTPRG